MPPSPHQPRAGWKGNLTPDQEAKLKELWSQLLQLSDPTSKQPVANGNVPSSPISPADDPAGSGKKKKRFNLFGGRKSTNGEEADNGSGINGGDPDAGEDKYNQAREFRAALAEQPPSELRDTIRAFTKADDPDALLLRFLRARKWNVHAALVMLVSTNRWRARQVQLDDVLLRNGEAWFAWQARQGSGANRKLGEDFMAQMRMGKSLVHGTDREGRPVCYVRVRLHRGGEFGEESLEKLTVYTIETARLMLRPPVDTAVLVFDMTGFSMANMDYTPVKFMIKVFEANYPESLGRICVHRSPWIFHGIWSIIRGWLDPVVAAKVHFTKDAAELSRFIDPTRIPKECGGEEDWEYRYVEPREDENRRMAEGERSGELKRVEDERKRIFEEFEAETRRWCGGEGGDECVRRREELIKDMGVNYWQLDPLVRARSVYDRLGIIRENGKVDFTADGRKSRDDDVD